MTWRSSSKRSASPQKINLPLLEKNMSDKLDAAARSLQQLQTCAKNALTEKTWLKARVWSVAFGVTLTALCVYCALLLQSNNRALHRLRIIARETCLKDPESTP